MKKKEFYMYKTGVDAAIEKLNNVYDEISSFQARIDELGFNCDKFGHPDLINNSIKQVEVINSEV